MQTQDILVEHYINPHSSFYFPPEYQPTPVHYQGYHYPPTPSDYSPTYRTVRQTFNFDMGAQLSPEDMKEFQKLSNEYEPDLQGPLVGPRQSSDMISSEYANADPIYVAKTTALAQSHSHYRIMKGDGNCGWRAVAFGYFENLFQLRDISRVNQELTRIKSFNKLLDSVGHQEHLYESFVDATEALLNQIAEAINGNVYDDTFLLDAFNKEYNSNAIIAHFRLMTSAWMKLNAARYEAFLPMPLDQYCARTIEPVKTEIDEVGLQGLVDGVIEGSGFAVEILYLDRSEGTEVTPHLLSPERPTIATIRLLYRPGHYDLLYQTDTNAPNSTITAVNFQYAMITDYAPWCSSALPIDLNPSLMAIPSLPLDVAVPSASPPVQSPSPYVYQMPQSPGFEPHAVPAPPPTALAPPIPLSPSSPNPMFPSSAPLSPVSVPDRSSELPIRLNPFTHEPMSQLPLTTVPFRNSHYNTAHFQNPDFQPSQWDPRDEYK